MFPGARMVRADLITRYSAVHLAALSPWEDEGGTLWQGTVLLGVSQGEGSAYRAESPTSPQPPPLHPRPRGPQS